MRRHNTGVGVIRFTVLVLACGFAWSSFALAEEPASAPTPSTTVQEEKATPAESGEVQERTVSLTQAVHFTDAKGQDVVVGPGSYRVDAEGTNQIRLVPAETGGAVVVEATSLTHQQTVESPVLVTIPVEDPDVIHLVLVLPNGQALDAAGSRSGVLSRATTSRAPLPAVTVQHALAVQGVINPGPILRSAVDCGRIPVLYEYANSGGRAFSLEFSRPNLHGYGFGDKGSSLCVPMGWTVTLYADLEYRGDDNVTIQGPAMLADLNRATPDGKKWADRVSSVRVEGAQANPPPWDCRRTPILFEHDHYFGRRFLLTNDVATLGTWSFGDNISSVCVPIGWTVQLYRDSGYTGDSLLVIGPKNLVDLQRESPGGRDWGDMFSSARVVTGPVGQANLPPLACANNPILFDRDNYRGQQFDLREHVPDLRLTGFNDIASSLCVPAGWMITLYEHPNYKGQAVLITPSQNWADLQRNGPMGDNWGGRVSSVAVARVPVPLPVRPPDRSHGLLEVR